MLENIKITANNINNTNNNLTDIIIKLNVPNLTINII